MSCDCKLVHLNLTGEIYPSRFSQRVSCDSMLGSMFVYFRVILECFQVHTDRILSDLNHWQQWWNFPRYNRICRNNYTATTTIKGETSNTTGWAPRQTQQPHRSIRNPFLPQQQRSPVSPRHDPYMPCPALNKRTLTVCQGGPSMFVPIARRFYPTFFRFFWPLPSLSSNDLSPPFGWATWVFENHSHCFGISDWCRQ